MQEFSSISAAARHVGFTGGTGGIRATCIGRNRYSHGYRWSYEKIDRLPPIRDDKGLHPVVQYDKHGNIIEVYSKIADAAKKYNVTHGAITSVCNGVHEYCAGYHWEFYKSKGA